MTGANGKIMRRMSSPGPGSDQCVTVLDIGSSKVCCLIARIDPAEASDDPASAERIHVVGFGNQASSGINDGGVSDMGAAEHAIRSAVAEAESMAGIEVKNVILSVSCGGLRSLNIAASHDLDGEGVTESDIENVFAAGQQYATREGRIILHMAPLGYTLDGTGGIQNPVGLAAEKLVADLHVVTADPQPLNNIERVVERCHLLVADIVPSPYASGLAAIHGEEAELGVACIDIGGGSIKLSVFADGHFIYADALGLGGRQITADIARSLSMPVQEAERIKTLHGCAVSAPSDEQELISYQAVGEDQFHSEEVTQAQLGMLIRSRLEEMLDAVWQRFENSDCAGLSGHRVVVTGGAANLPGLADLTAKHLGKSARIGRPQGIAGLPEVASRPDFSAAAGALLYTLKPHLMFERGPEFEPPDPSSGYIKRMGQWLRESF